MKVLYLTSWDFSNEKTDGVCKKIRSQIKTFTNSGCSVDFIYIDNHDIVYIKDDVKNVIGHVGNIKKTMAYAKLYSTIKTKGYDVVYNRFSMFDAFYFRVLKRLKENGAKIIVEIPTYPYNAERRAGLLNWLFFAWDRIYQSHAAEAIDVIATYSNDDCIWDVPTIKISNGIDVASYPLVDAKGSEDGTINLIAVALLQPAHGYEKLLNAIADYYDNNGDRNIVFNIVGDGPEKALYEQIVDARHIHEHVIFWGRKGGEDLDNIYSKMDIGICSFGAYKKNLYYSSGLKSREYMARGIPFQIAVDMDVEPLLDEDMFVKYPNNPDPINVDKIIELYDRTHPIREELSNRMRKLAQKYVGMDTVMAPVIDYINGK